MRLKCGADNLCGAFYEHLKANPRLTASRLNDSAITFPTLYILMPHIQSANAVRLLNQRGQFTLSFYSREHRAFNSALEKGWLSWIVKTGALDDGLCCDFDELIDIACQKLIVGHSDTSIIPTAIDLMFKRNRKGGHVHDLAWCVCESGHVSAMELISEYLRSDLSEDNMLACRLLNFKPELQPQDKQIQYQNFHRWLKENKQFLYPARQSFNQSSNPKAWRVDQGSKYLYKSAATPASSQYKRVVDEFNSLDEEDQKLLAKYSFKLHHNDIRAWNNFVSSPVEHQIGIARMAEGGAYYI